MKPSKVWRVECRMAHRTSTRRFNTEAEARAFAGKQERTFGWICTKWRWFVRYDEGTVITAAAASRCTSAARRRRVGCKCGLERWFRSEGDIGMAHYTPQEYREALVAPLPPMHGAELFCGGDAYSYTRGALPTNHGGTPLYTADQMRDFALAERAACAAICEHEAEHNGLAAGWHLAVLIRERSNVSVQPAPKAVGCN